MFADRVLAVRIERAEAELTAGIVRSATDPLAIVLPAGGGVAAFARAGSPINKLIGAGFSGALDVAELAAAEAAYAARGEPVRVELATLVDAEIVVALVDRGYALRGFENVLGLDLRAGAAVPCAGIDVAEVDATALDWNATMIDGFAAADGTGAVADQLTRDAVAEGFADIARAVELRRYVARIDGIVVGAAAARYGSGVAQLCGATTLPAFRRRGVQRALFEHRLAAARAEGCDVAVVTTAPGSQSQANAARRGFALLYARAVLVRPAPR